MDDRGSAVREFGLATGLIVPGSDKLEACGYAVHIGCCNAKTDAPGDLGQCRKCRRFAHETFVGLVVGRTLCEHAVLDMRQKNVQVLGPGCTIATTDIDHPSVEKIRRTYSRHLLRTVDHAIVAIGDQNSFARQTLGSTDIKRSPFRKYFENLLTGAEGFRPLTRYADGASSVDMQAIRDLAAHSAYKMFERARTYSKTCKGKLEMSDVFFYVGWCLSLLPRWAGNDQAMVQLLKGGRKSDTAYALVGFAYLAGQMRPATFHNQTPEHYASMGVRDAGFAVLGNSDLLGKQEAKMSGCTITVDGDSFEFTTNGIDNGANRAKLMDLHKVLTGRYSDASRPRKDKVIDTSTYHTALNQILQVHTYKQEEGKDSIEHPQFYGHNAYFFMLVKQDSLRNLFPGHTVHQSEADGQSEGDDISE